MQTMNVMVPEKKEKLEISTKPTLKLEVKTEGYDPYNRNPLYAGAEATVFDELVKLTKHFHPTVSLYAGKIINGKNQSKL